MDEINRLDVRIGDTIVLQKAGDVIPEVVEVVKKLRTGKEKQFKMPAKCPYCGEKTGRKKIDEKRSEVAYYCLNPHCFSVQKRGIIHFVSKKATNVEGLGKKLVEQLMDEGLVEDPADFYSLTVEDLKPLERFAQKKAENIIAAIAHAKKIELSRFIFALGIRHVGEEMARILAQYLAEQGGLRTAHYSSAISVSQFVRVISGLSPEELEAIEGAGDKIAGSVKEYFSRKTSQKLLKKLNKAEITILLPAPKKKSSKISGKTFVLTGSMKDYSREEAKKEIIDRGGKVSSSVSSQTDFLVAGEEPGSKLEKARKLGVTVVGEGEFDDLLKT